MATPSTISTYTSSTRNKLLPLSLIPLQTFTTTTNRNVISSIADVTNISAVKVFIHFGRIVAATLTNGVNFRIEASSQTSGDNNWFPDTIFTSGVAAATSTTVSTESAAGQNVLTVTAAGSFAAGNIIYIQNATEANSEFARVVLVTGGAGGTLTLENNLTFTQQVGAIVTNSAEMYSPLIDTSTYTRLRVVVDGSAGVAQNFDAEVAMTVGA